MLNKKVIRVLGVAMLTSIATLAFAEDAPVYDADNFPQQFDGQPYGNENASYQPSYQYGQGQQQPSSLEQRVTRAERQINNLQQVNTSSKLDALQGEVQSLRGQVEQLTRQLQQAQNQQTTMYSDLDKRIQQGVKTPPPSVDDSGSTNSSEVKALRAQVEQLTRQIQQTQEPQNSVATAVPVKSKPKLANSQTVTASSSTSLAKTNDQPNVAEEQQIYQTAYDLIKAKKYNEAISALQKMLQKYPSGQFAANAHFWLGELYGLLGKNEKSALEFGSVVKNYPDSPKVSDAQLKLGLTYVAQFKWSDAKAAFKKVINRYPGTASARLASQQLKQIKAAGH